MKELTLRGGNMPLGAQLINSAQLINAKLGLELRFFSL